MASTNEIRHRIAAVEQTSKITGAMEMVSSNRMRRVMSHIEYNKKYFDYIRMAMREILSSSEGVTHPYLTERPERRRTYIVIAGDKGLCGPYNASVIALAEQQLEEFPESTLITIGNTAEDHFRRRGRIPDITMLGIVQDPTMKAARRISRDIMNLYDEELTDEIHVIYTSFYGATKNKPVKFRLLPVILHDYDDVAAGRNKSDEILYHPSQQAVFDELVPQYILGLMFGVMVQAYAGEHYSRMNAMHSSTQNANDMLKTLTTQYNMARQSAITNELSEITGAAEIMRTGNI
jgi:F-type H+-transporting ATPase subunit gamma